MKRQDITKLHHETSKELAGRISAMQKDLVETRMNISLGKEKNLKRMSNLKTDIARIKTILHAKNQTENK